MQAVDAPPLTAVARLASRAFRVTILAAGLLLAVVVLGNLVFGQKTTWAWGGIKCGDLVQHYGAGLLWSEGRIEELYRGFRFGSFLNTWTQELDPGAGPGRMERFNYVYAPLVAWTASAATAWDYGTWVNAWLVLSLAAWIGAFLCLRAWVPNVFRLDFTTLVLYFGFPAFYWGLVPGQNTALTLAIACSALLLQARARPLAAGLVMGCAFYKPQLMPALFLFMACGGHARFCAGLALGNLAWLGLGGLLCGVPAHHYWLESLADMARGLQFQKPGMNQSWSGLLPGIPLLGPVLALGIPVAAGCWMRGRLGPAPALACALAAGLAAAPYLGYYELLLGVPWWWWTFRKHGGTSAAVLYYILAWAAVAGLLLQQSITAPLLTLWLVLTLRRSARAPGPGGASGGSPAAAARP